MKFTKNPIFSKTIQGLLVGLLPVVLPLIGIPITPEIQALIGALGASWGAYGRTVANGPLVK